jgi:bromodomain-containing factor 1
VQDIRQIWENTRKFNGPSHVVSLQAAKLDDVFEKGFKNMPAEVGSIIVRGQFR